MPRYTVHLCAYRLESNRMEIEADTPEAACDVALIEDDGAYVRVFDSAHAFVQDFEGSGATIVDAKNYAYAKLIRDIPNLETLMKERGFTVELALTALHEMEGD